MTYEQVEAFISTVTYGSITKAAQALFLSQSTVSTRIQQLESELGVRLFVRNRGKRHIELTSHGERFLPIAERWSALWKDTLSLKSHEDIQILTIASVDVVNQHSLSPFFNLFISRNSNIRLTLLTHHSDQIHSLVEQRVADVGFVYRNISLPGVSSEAIFREPMFLICHKESSYHDGMNSESLDPSHEVYLDWSIEWRRWHERHWGQNVLSLVSVDSASPLPHYLITPGSWAIAPASVIKHALLINPQLVSYQLADPPEPLTCYRLLNRNPAEMRSDLLDQLNAELDEFVRQSDILLPCSS